MFSNTSLRLYTTAATLGQQLNLLTVLELPKPLFVRKLTLQITSGFTADCLQEVLTVFLTATVRTIVTSNLWWSMHLEMFLVRCLRLLVCLLMLTETTLYRLLIFQLRPSQRQEIL